MAQVITGLDNIPLSAISAAYAPTNTADVTAMIDSAVSGKLDASASSSFQPVGNYVSSDDLSAYLPTSSIGVDSASAVTSIAGSSVGGGTDITYNIGGSSFTATGFQTSYASSYSTTAISHVRDSADDRPLEASYLKPGTLQQSGSAYKLAFSPAQSMWTTADVATGIFSPLQYGTGAGMFMDNSSFKGYLKGNEIFISNTAIGKAARMEVHGTRDARVGLTGDKNGNVTANFKPSEISFCSAGVATATYGRTKIGLSSTESGTAAYGINYINLYDTSESAQKTISSTSVDYWNGKLDASSIETSVDGITGIAGTAIAGGGGTTYTAGQYIQISGDEISVTGLQPSGDYVSSSELADYQPTSSMSAYATTGDLSAKLDVSASSSFITSTADCMPLSSSSEYYSTSNPSGFITSSYNPTFGYYNGSISSIDGTGLMGTDTAVVSTNTAQSFANIESGLPIDDTISFDTPVTSIKITVPDELGTEPVFNLNADNPDGNLTVYPMAGSDSYYTYNTSLGGSGWTSISFDDPDYLSKGGIRYISATGYSDGVTSTAELMHLSASSNFYSTSNPAGYITGVDLSPYQTTAGMSAYATTGDLSAKLDASASSSFLTAQEQASWSETASASPSYIVDKPDLVDIVAGPGIVVDNPDGNTLRVSMADSETVLWTGNAVTSAINLSEAPINFEYLRVYIKRQANLEGFTKILEFPVKTANVSFPLMLTYESIESTTSYATYITRYNGNTSNVGFTFAFAQKISSTVGGSVTHASDSGTIEIYKITGIHRIANN